MNLCEFGLEMGEGLSSILVIALQWLLYHSHKAKNEKKVISTKAHWARFRREKNIFFANKRESFAY